MSISPGSYSGGSDSSWRPEPSSGRSKGFTVVILVALVLMIGATVYLFVELRATRQTIEQANLKIQTHEEHIAKLEGSVIRTTRQVGQVEESTSALKGEVSSTRGQIAQATKQVETKVMSTTDRKSTRLNSSH